MSIETGKTQGAHSHTDAGALRHAPVSGGAGGRWLWAGYIFIAVFFASRLAYIASGRIQLSEDEAYQWLWSKHLALSYYSKPPLIAWLQWIGTRLWGDTEFGVRFCSPVLAGLLSVGLLRFIAAEANARAAFWLVVVLAATPLLAVGSTLLTVDAPSVFFWVAALIAGWRAMQSDGLKYWCWTGVFTGLGLLSKYTAVAQVLSWGVFFTLWAPARRHLRRPGPYVALGIALLAFLPVIWWNHQHGWITVTHLKERGGLTEVWHLRARFIGEFLGGEFGLLNPVFFVASVWAAVGLWLLKPRRPLLIYLFCMGAPLFLLYLLYTIHSRVQLNWIAPSVVPLFAVMVLFWDERWRAGCRAVQRWLAGGLVLGFIAVGLLHGTELVQVLTGRPIPVRFDPLHRVRAWTDIASMFEKEREKILTEGKPVFFITRDYDLASILSFYVPAAKQGVPGAPLVYTLRTAHPENQFYFWPAYEMRKGENALFLEETDDPMPAPRTLLADFESVTNLGMREAFYYGQEFRRYQVYLCRDLK